jgi:hypothetical protein
LKGAAASCAQDPLEVVGVGDVFRQACLHPDDHIVIARDRASGQCNVGEIDVVQFAAGTHDAAARDVDQQAAEKFGSANRH